MASRYLYLCAFILFINAGCQPAPAPAPTTANHKTDIRIRTPGVNVDVQGDDKKTDVDVRKKDR